VSTEEPFGLGHVHEQREVKADALLILILLLIIILTNHGL
jgi:hypothetical protein